MILSSPHIHKTLAIQLFVYVRYCFCFSWMEEEGVLVTCFRDGTRAFRDGDGAGNKFGKI